MGFLLAVPVRLLLAVLQRLSLRTTVQIGRGLGGVAWWILRRHRRVALENLTAAFKDELSPAEIHALARENFRRLGENYAGGARTAAMSDAELKEIVEITGTENLPQLGGPHPNLVFATGHFGNFELCTRGQAFLTGWQCAATYRSLKPPALDRILQELRSHAPIRFFERTRDARALRQMMAKGGVALGLLADQHGGTKGFWLPFFGRPCSTSGSAAILAQRYHAPIQTLLCFRVGLGRWRLEFGEIIPTHLPDGSPRDPAAIMRDVNACYEAAIRRDPANWFWVHRRWKPPTDRQLAQAGRVSDSNSGSDFGTE